MAFLFYVRLIALTAGTLVYLFLIALILGHRRPRLFERLLFFLVLALLAIYGGGLLEINARIQYGTPPDATRLLYTSLIAFGLFFLPGLLFHTVAQYCRLLNPRFVPRAMVAIGAALFYLFPFALPVDKAIVLSGLPGWKFDWSLQSLLWALRREDTMLLMFSVVLSAGLSFLVARAAQAGRDGRFLRWFSATLVVALVPLALWNGFATLAPIQSEGAVVAIIIGGILPGALLIYYALEHNFLEYGEQRNLVYALSATVLALLYLALVHRVSGWLAPVFPPEATASVLLFVLVFLFEPLERVLGPAIHRTLRERVDRWQRLAVELQEEARHGDVARLLVGAERRIRDEFSLAAVRIAVPRDRTLAPLESPGGLGHVARIPLRKGKEEIGLLEAATTGSYLTGETSAALEFLAEQLPAMIDLCRLIEEKIRLERELAERERLALVGQMAASVSHNLRNPLGAMKTVLQVQLENPDLADDLRRDFELVIGEIDRMNAKLTQLLRFAKPSTSGTRAGAAEAAGRVVALFRPDAERRGVRLELETAGGNAAAQASEEALNEILSNLVVNAIEAQPDGGQVRLRVASDGGHVEIVVEDDGPGISPEAREKIFQPFFTTKATGTGLGLAIVARRASEMGGTIACESPVADGKGTRIRLRLPLAAGSGEAGPDSSEAAERADPSLRLPQRQARSG
ncbi:MAG TPA: ATP-binding protein [Candidatus Aquilonibacter sp.]|nr:ATP-binding protein [Candidatus Aquilonibacter sp.]